MEFIVLIIALLLERFVHVESYVKRFSWFKTYLDFIKAAVDKTGLMKGYPGLLICVLPILIVVWIVYSLLDSIAFGFVGFVLALLILVYTLGPKDLYYAYEKFFLAQVQNDPQARADSLKDLLCEIPDTSEAQNEALCKHVFTQYNHCLFTVIFWFILLGPMAALLYRLVAQVFTEAHTKDSPYQKLLPEVSCVLKIIEWLPIRVAGILFSLMGDFHHGFGYWLRHVGSGLKQNYEFIQNMGLAALGIQKETEVSFDTAKIKAALRLIDRSLITFVVIVALFVLGAIIY